MAPHLLAVALFFGPLSAAAATATLVSFQGGVFITPQGGRERPATAGSTLEPGTKIRTDSTGTAELTYDDGSLLRLRPDSAMQLSARERKRSKSSVILFFGNLWHKVAGQRDGGYEVNTPNAVCGVRGTSFETVVGDDGTLHMQVSEGTVEVSSDANSVAVGAGQSVEANEAGVGATGAGTSMDWSAWHSARQEALRERSAKLVEALKTRVRNCQTHSEALRIRQRGVLKQRKNVEARARKGEPSAADELKRHQQELARLADELADQSDKAESCIGAVDHFIDLAGDPRFAGINRKHLVAEAKALRKIKANLDKLVRDGTDISQEAMDKLLEDMGQGERGSLREKKGSTKDELFDNE